MQTETHSARTLGFQLMGLCLLLPVLTGCIRGQYHGISALNPYMRKQWSEDEQMGPTFHQQMAELRDLKRSARSLGADEQERLVAQMTSFVRDDENPLIRAGSVRVLGEIPTASALPGIQAASVDPEPQVRIASCQAFGRRADAESAGTLARLAAQDGDTDVRLAAVSALGKCKDQQAVQALSLALDDSNPAIQNRAVQSLKTSTGQTLGNNVAAWQAYLRGEPSPVQPAASIAERFQQIFY